MGELVGLHSIGKNPPVPHEAVTSRPYQVWGCICTVASAGAPAALTNDNVEQLLAATALVGMVKPPVNGNIKAPRSSRTIGLLLVLDPDQLMLCQ